jgi:hypothetical protein
MALSIENHEKKKRGRYNNYWKRGASGTAETRIRFLLSSFLPTSLPSSPLLFGRVVEGITKHGPNIQRNEFALNRPVERTIQL